MSQELTPQHLDDARTRGFVNHCAQQGIEAEDISTLVTDVYRPLDSQRQESLASIATTITGD